MIHIYDIAPYIYDTAPHIADHLKHCNMAEDKTSTRT